MDKKGLNMNISDSEIPIFFTGDQVLGQLLTRGCHNRALVTTKLHISPQSRLCTQLRTTRASRVSRNLVSPEAVFTWQTNILCQRRHQREFRCN